MNPVYEIKGLRKHYDDGRVQALRGVDLRVSTRLLHRPPNVLRRTLFRPWGHV
mgnify:CR=1 FL=1